MHTAVEAHKRSDRCDVIVVGAGLVGAAVAARLAREEVDMAILEARNVAGGATGRSAGMVLTGLGGHYNWAVSAYGSEQAHEVWRLTIEGRERLVEAAERLDVPVEHTGSLTLAVEEAEVDALQESAVLLREDGLDVEFDPADPLGRGFRAALRYPHDVSVDAAALTQALLVSSGVIVHEGTEVYNLAPDPAGLQVWARNRTVVCNSVVLAINGYAPLFDSYFADKIAPTRSLVLATEPLDTGMLNCPCCADYGNAYCRQLPDHRLLLGGWQRSRQQSGQAVEPGDVVLDGLIRFAARHFPEVNTSKTSRWSEVMGFAPDGLPLVGQVPGLPQVYFAVGLGGRGLAWAFVVAQRVVDLMLQGSAPGILAADRLT